MILVLIIFTSFTGSYRYTFTSPGTYFYGSGPIGVGGHVLKGIINVMENSIAKQLSVVLAGFEAQHDMSQSGR